MLAPFQVCPDAPRPGERPQSRMPEKTDRFPLLRFIVWFGGLLAVATLLALLMARAEADALPAAAPVAAPADAPAQVSPEVKR